MSLEDKLTFLSAFFSRPHVIGAVAPSSAALARKMIEWVEWETVETVVEYGPGTGSFTNEILVAKRSNARYFAIELEAALVETMQRRFPDVAVHHNSVANVRAICTKEGVDKVDAIVSGLPWAAFPESQQVAFMDAMMTVLRPGGQFVTFAYLQGLCLPAGQRFRRMLRQYFSEVSTSGTVWPNVPPAFVYRCRR